MKLRLRLQPAAHRIHSARELGKDAVAGRVGDAAAVLGHDAVEDSSMRAQNLQRGGLIIVHVAGVALHIGGKDSDEAAFEHGRLTA